MLGTRTGSFDVRHPVVKKEVWIIKAVQVILKLNVGEEG